jgi:thiopeptide-type bacteriocin biosynthesis protein
MFYIRYHDGRPHVRLRALGITASAAERLRLIIALAVEDFCRTLDSGNASVRHAQQLSVEWHPYQPEYERYGGIKGVAIAERLFVASSMGAIATISHRSEYSRDARLNDALLAMLLALRAFWPVTSHAARAAMAYGNGYAAYQTSERVPQGTFSAQQLRTRAGRAIGQIAALWAALEHGAPPPSALKNYSRSLSATMRALRREWTSDSDEVFDRRARFIVPSYMHMMNNRLGISTREEALLGQVVGLALGAQHNEVIS